MEIIPRFLTPVSQSFFLFGPRGTGKSTWLRQKYPDAFYINLLEADVLREYLARPERLRLLVDGNPDKKIFVIDEIQKAPVLLSMVHSLLEEKKGITFILTGSSARKLKKSGVDLLAGRAIRMSLHPFMAAELGDRFDIRAALLCGMVPVVVAAPDPAVVLKTYIDIYIQEEVKAEGLVRDLGAFLRFLEVAALSHGQMLNLSNVAQDCQVGRKTVEGYFSILEDLLLAFKVPVFTRRAQRALVAHPKFYFFDCGVYRTIRPRGPLDSPQEIAGASVEGIVAQHLRAWLDYRGGNARLYYWRTRAGNEVDFVAYGESLFFAVEVKAAERIKSEDLRGLKTFREDYPESKQLLVYMGKERVQIDGIMCVPCSEFLLSLDLGKNLY